MGRAAQRMARDRARFREIVRGKLREDLRQYLQNSELIGRQGGRVISIPVPSIELPRFRYGNGEESEAGTGTGDGEAGSGSGQEGETGSQGGGDQPGQHALEVDVEIEELAELLGEELGLPRIEPRGKKQLVVDGGRYTRAATHRAEFIEAIPPVFSQWPAKDHSVGSVGSGGSQGPAHGQ